MSGRLIALLSVIGLGLFQPAVAQAPAITVLSSNGLRAVLTELIPQFEHLTGRKVVVTYSVAAELKRRIDDGASFDVAVLTPGLIDELIAGGAMMSVSRTSIARAGMALAVRSGTTKPDIRTIESLTQALRSASSIAFAKEGAGGVFFAALMPRLGLTDVLAPKLRPFTTGTEVSAAIARGDAQLGLLPLSELLTVPGVDVVGPFPAGIQGYAVMVAGISARAAQPAVGQRLIEYLASADVTPLVIKHGMERVP
jgi:molybdate transport system substrate-binding protein